MVRVALICSLLVSSSYATRGIRLQTEECPLWTVANNDTEGCVCAQSDHLIVRCNTSPYSVSVRILHCMTADTDLNPVVGSCLYNSSIEIYNIINRLEYFTGFYNKFSTNSSTDINRETCGPYQRKGLMCGQCIKDYGLPVYSYNLACVKCVDYKYNWLKYIAAAYLPLTVFYLIIIVFKISANSGLLVGCVTISQMVATYNLVQVYLAVNPQTITSSFVVKVIACLYSIWNLDFFRSVYPPFCLHPNMSALGVLSLDYLVAVYPLFAVISTYIIVKKFSYVSCSSGPLNKCLYLFIKVGNAGNSLIEAFATLILLSYVKVLNVSFNIITPTYLYNLNGTHGYPYVYNDPHTVYLSKQHLPYLVLAFAMSFVFNFLPFLLICLYPFACFQKCLNWTGLRHPALCIFMDAFQGSYKHKPCYLRSFPAIYLIAHFTNLLILSSLGIEQYFAAASLNLLMVILMIAIFRPYKNKWHSVITLTLLSSVSIAYYYFVFVIYSAITVQIPYIWAVFLEGVYSIGFLVPALYGMFLFILGILPATIMSKLNRSIKKFKIIQNSVHTLSPSYEFCHENTPFLNH